MNRINFKQERDLGTTLQDASSFITQNFIKIMKPTLIVVVVPLLLGAIMMISGIQNMFSNMQGSDPSQVLTQLGGIMFPYFLLMVAFVLAYVMFIGYIKLYTEGQDDITLGDLMPILKSKGISLVLSMIVLAIVMYIGTFLCLLPGIYLSVVFAHFFAISIIEETGFGTTWKRSFYLIKDNWWNSFGLYIVTYLISIAIMILIYIPAYAVMGIQMFSVAEQNDPAAMMENMSSMMSYLLPFYYLIGLVISLLFAVVSSLRYFSLVEKKEGTGERELINQL